MGSWLTDTEDGGWASEKDVESPVPLTLTADEPVYDDGVLKVNISWSAGQSVRCLSQLQHTSGKLSSNHTVCPRNKLKLFFLSFFLLFGADSC